MRANSQSARLTVATDWRSCHDDTYYWIQCGIRYIQEPKFQRLGMRLFSQLNSKQGPQREIAMACMLTICQDLGGQTSIRPYWRCYYANTAAVIFVVDSTDIERLQTAAEELSAMLNEEELKDAALLVFANKQDQPGAKGAGEISEALRLGELRDRNWSIMACSAVDGSGVNEGMDWLVVS